MRTLSGIYKGARVVQLQDDVDLPTDLKVVVVIPECDDETALRRQLLHTAEQAFAKLWDNEQDEVWREYL
ncbi:MAG: hypothetical protein FJ279_03670 [Planctomycetes bacterium]|nr:hypothetical protein [Planctomycetota bacterium]MBM4086538.1 hypothetical protein [Planctomycetota bacterium]